MNRRFLLIAAMLAVRAVAHETAAPAATPKPSVWDTSHWYYVHPDERGNRSSKT